ncbi:MAG: protein translocase subunit SecD [Janthinobacterium lividum]
MMYFSRLKVTLILAVCALGVLFCLPNALPAPASWVPWRQVHLGLDLRGGSYLLLEVDMAAVAKERLDSLADGARTTLRGKVTGFQPPVSQPAQNRVLIRMAPGPQQDDALKLLRDAATSTGTTEYQVGAEGSDISLTIPPAALRDRANAAVIQSIEIVRRRIDETGVLDPQITRQGDARIVVQLPGVEDPNRIKALIGKTARMTFRLLDETANLAGAPPPGVDFLPVEGQPGVREPVRRRTEVDGANLTDARPGQDSQRGGGWVVNFTFDSVGARRFADVSTANVGKRFAIVLDDRVISAPVINQAITGGRGQISGNFNAQSANDLSVLLRAGALPAPLTVVEERSVGPELGADSIRAGAIALAIGFALVILYMALFYGLFGWFANIALLVNLVLQIAVLSLLEATLTLPGMAGILLTLGVAVDANILINERIREEVHNGRTPLNALETGFRRAYGTIVDSNATAFLAHVMLFVFGSGPVRGFAVTITVGIVTTLFTATLLARLLTVRWYVRNRPQTLPV